ncbi:MAG: cell surface protein SprA [Rubricoccaceae bacterium]|nr:cell surface protein SprA [Rubricoccaceae bacterium]
MLMDSSEFRYTVTEEVSGQEVRVPAETDLVGYRAARLRSGIRSTFRELAARRGRRPGRGGFGITIDIPGGNESAFSSIFGRNEVDLRVNGQANIDVGFDYQTNEIQEAATGQGGSINPDFGQELSLGITGTIGDKLRVNVNYDTQNTFDFENQVSLVYEGYDDDIIQRIEAGNVFLQTPSELIRGGQRLFGLRTDLQFGGLGITAVASQQDAESDALNIEGGSQSTEFDIQPYEYEDNTHFFLAYHFRNWWDAGHENPNNRTLSPGFDQIIGLEVWLHDNAVINTTGTGEELVYATALLDLAEPGPGNTIPNAPPRGVLDGADAYLNAFGDVAPVPDGAIDQYTDDDLALLRDSLNQIDLEADYDLAEADFETTRFRRLQPDVDYTFDPYLGYLSLKRSLSENERIAVAYQYINANGATITVGDYGQGSTSGSSNGDRIILKLLRGNTPTPNDASWGLTMRNIYRIGGRSLTPDAFDFDITYSPSGSTPQRTLPNVTIGQQQTLLQTLGLDRLNREGTTQPDDVFDFKDQITIDPGAGRVIFPNREPFGAYLRALLEGEFEDINVVFQGTNPDDAVAAFAFDTLYSLKPEVARREFPNLDRYALAGEFRSSVQSIYELGFAVVEGSVVVTSGSIQLTEGSDYTVNYASGTVEITNPAFLTPGQNLRIDYERNQFAAIGSKTLLGLRADYTFGDDLSLGATWMQLSERPLIDKYRIGEEPLSNTIIGFDGQFQAEPRWLTRAVDAIPLIQTRAPSRLDLKAEFAQLSPGHPETFAFQQERDALEAINRDFKEDELNGISFVDDFEGIENVFSLLQPGAWRMAAAPDGAGPEDATSWVAGVPVTDPSLRTNWRGLFTWYSVLASTYRSDLCEEVECTNRATRQVLIREIFPDREVQRGQPETLSLLDMYVDPTRRGPYNYNGELQSTFAGNPQDVWGGVVQRLPEGYTDFGGRNNIEFVEFIFSPVGGRNGNEPIDPGAVLYVDLGKVSEDIIPNRQFNEEDGLNNSPLENANSDAWGRLPDGLANTVVDFDEEGTGQTEDLGLDGLRSAAQNPLGEDYAAGERTYFDEFIQSLAGGSPERLVAEEDASADDYHHFEEAGYFNDGNRFEGGRATLQERFTRFFPGLELNAFESQQKIANNGQSGNSRFPDSEDINGNQSLDLAESHFRYEIPLDDANLRSSPFFQNEIVTPSGESWYLVRIPVRSDARESVGGIEDFSLIETIRLWTTGHARPATLRFATLELVGSQWLKSERVGIQEPGVEPPLRPTPRLFIETVNNEENPSQYAIPLGAIVSRTPDISGNLIRQREQSLVFRIENFAERSSRAIYKPFSTNPLDLTKYSNVRMFTHAEGFERQDSVRVFVRLGGNETQDYYEYEQPLYPYEIPELEGGMSPNPDSLWQTNVPIGGGEVVDLNSINIVLSELNKLKAERDNDPSIPIDERYSSGFTPEGAPPGSRITIRGNPTIQNVTTVVVGLRNANGGTTAPLENVEVWFNELRVTGYDEESGWSAYARATVQFADVANVNARFSRQTDGFGELGSGLGDRDFNDRQDYSILASFNAHKLLPERFGWNIPISLSVQENLTTPRYAPRRGDIRVEELIAQAEEDPDLSAEERAERVEQIRAESETSSFTRSLRVPISKSGSGSGFLRYTLDGMSFVYTNTAGRSRSPSFEINNSDRWSGTFTYRVTVPRARTVRPFWFVEDVPLLGVLGGLRLNYLPQSFSFTADADRTVRRDRERRRIEDASNPLLEGVPERFLYPTRRDQTFGHGRTFDFNYNPFTFLALTYRSDVNQSLTGAGADEGFELFVRDSTGTSREYDISRDEAFAPGGIGRTDFGIPDSVNVNQIPGFQIYEVRTLDILPVGEVASAIFNGERRVLTDRFTQSMSGTFQPQLDRYRLLSWFRIQPLSYSSQFTWSYTPLNNIDEDITVANVGSQATIRGGVQLRPREFWRLFNFYRGIEEADRSAGNDRPGENRGAAGGRGRPNEVPETPDDPTDENQTTEAGEDNGGPRLPNVGGLLRKIFLGLTGIDDFTVTYSGTRGASADGLVGNNYSLYDALLGDGPSLGYRLAIDRHIPLSERLATSELQFQDNISDSHRLNGRTTVRFGNDLNINLTWDTNWNQSDATTFASVDGVLEERPSTSRGSGQSTIVAFGGSYDSFLELHRQRFQEDVFGPGAIQDSLGRYRSEVLTRTGVTQDFRAAFVDGMGSFGSNGFFAIPLPNWDVSYSGLSRWPLLSALANQVTLRHGYSATYDLSYASNAAAGEPTQTRTFLIPGESGGLTPRSVVSEIPFLEPGTALVNQRFQPLIGVNVTWKGGLQTDFGWSQSNTYALSTATASLTEGSTDELSLRLTYSKRGLRLPFFGRRQLNNNLRFTLTLSRSDSRDFSRFLRNDLEDLLSGSDLTEPQVVGSTRFTAEPRLSYALSNQVNMDVFVRYETVESEGSQIPSTSLINGGFNFRVSFSN